MGSIIGAMSAEMDARALLESLVGQQIHTVTGRPNTVMAVAGDIVTVATDRSPAGEPVPIEWVQSGLDRLLETGEIEVGVPSLGYRGAFVAAVLLKVPGAVLVPTTPRRIRLTDPLGAYRLNEAGPVNAWWAGDPRQRFWLETTDRPDIGVDLHCPQRDTVGNRSPGFSLIWWVEPDDVVFHYSLNEYAILRERADDIRAVLEQLKSDHDGSLYFPFFLWGGSQLRPMQPYVSKLPAELLGLFPQLTGAAAASLVESPQPPAPGAQGLGTSYRQAQVGPWPSGRQPSTPDPALVERGLKGHADIQNELAQVLRNPGIEPRSPLPSEPNFDLAWEANGTVFVAEIKSISDDNEEGQLRLGLGQVLRYRHRLARLGHQRVVAVLVPERTPHDGSWENLCHELGVVLLSGSEIEDAPTLTPM